jgi:hypothetical protein
LFGLIVSSVSLIRLYSIEHSVEHAVSMGI